MVKIDIHIDKRDLMDISDVNSDMVERLNRSQLDRISDILSDVLMKIVPEELEGVILDNYPQVIVPNSQISLIDEITKIIERHDYDDFESYNTSEFSKRLMHFIRKHRNNGLQALRIYIRHNIKNIHYAVPEAFKHLDKAKNISHDDLVEFLSEFIKSDNLEIRMAAFSAMGCIHTPDLIPALIYAADQPHNANKYRDYFLKLVESIQSNVQLERE